MRHVHLGLGRFHRAHQAFYLNNVGIPITAFSMRHPAEADALQGAGGRYRLSILGDGQRQDLEIAAIDEALFIGRPEERERFFCLLEGPSVTTLTLTVTEKGYGYTPAGELDLGRADHGSVVALLVDAIRRRQALHRRPLAVMSCDNLSENGRHLQRACRSWADHQGFDFDKRLVGFPNSMVDRIVPSGPSPLLVETEAFHQWVIEDRFHEARPAWDQEGLMFVPRVEPFELLKLRLLNAAHSFLAYAGLLRGYSFVHQAIADPELRTLVERLFFEEVGPTLEVPAPLALRDYGDSLLRRFDNPHLPHRLAQIAMDGSQKLPQRVLPGLPDSSVLRLCLDAWLTYMWLGLRKELFPVADPHADRMRELLSDSFENTVPAWLGLLGWDLKLDWRPRMVVLPHLS